MTLTGAAVTPLTFAYAGQPFDSETGLYLFRARYYDPAVGRFYSPDPLDYGKLMFLAQRFSPVNPLIPVTAEVVLQAPRIGGSYSSVLRGRSFAPRGWNSYGYAVNNPLLVRDTSGLDGMNYIYEDERQVDVGQAINGAVIEACGNPRSLSYGLCNNASLRQQYRDQQQQQRLLQFDQGSATQSAPKPAPAVNPFAPSARPESLVPPDTNGSATNACSTDG